MVADSRLRVRACGPGVPRSDSFPCVSSYSPGIPTSFAATYVTRNMARYQGTFGDALRRFLRSPATFPGSPASVFVGFASGASQYEDTGALWRGTVPNLNFKETSYLGTESGPTFIGPTAAACSRRQLPFAQCTFGPAPNPDPTLPFSNYARWATHEYIRRADMLGRNASLASGACFDVVQATAVGLLNLRWHQGQVNNLLPESIRATVPGGQYGVMLAFMGWSMGPAGAASALRPFAAELAAVDEASRPGVWLWNVARRIANNTLPGTRTSRSYTNIAFAAARIFQKVTAGRVTEVGAGNAAARWYALGMSPIQEAVVFDVIARRAYGVAVPSGLDLGPQPRIILPAGNPPGPAQIIEFLPSPSTPWDAVSAVTPKERAPEDEDDLLLDWTNLKTVEDVLPEHVVEWMASYGLPAQKALWRRWEAVLYGEPPVA